MSALLDLLINSLEQFSSQVPLPLFVIIGTFVEDIIAPIPSPLVMTLAGSLAASQERVFSYLLFIAFVGAIGKTVGAYVFCVLADKFEDLVLNKFGKYLGISHREIETIGKHLNQGYRDDIVLFLLRAIPIIPTAPVSLVAGFVKLNIRTYLVSTFIGFFFRNIFYLYFGYTSLGALESIQQQLDGYESIGYVILFLLFVAAAALLILKQKKGEVIKERLFAAVLRIKDRFL